MVRTSFAAIFKNELLLNSKRVAPYLMAILFGSNAVLWWGWGPAAGQGWATNSDAFIAGVLPVFSFMTLPLFTALLMADPVIRDFRIGIAPLILSKPVSRAEYLLGKFFGNFFVLACCQSVFVITLFALQWFRTPGVIVLEVRTLTYLKHFLVFVVISHLVLAAFYFTVGTLTRNARIAYALGFSFYPLYIAYQVVVLKKLSPRWQSVFDPLLMNWGKKFTKVRSAEWMNQLVVVYDSDLVVNRGLMIFIAAICLTILCSRFSINERPESNDVFSTLKLSTATDRIHLYSETLRPARNTQLETIDIQNNTFGSSVRLPHVTRANEGLGALLNKLIGFLGTEFRLLRSERGLVVVLPLAMLFSFLSLPFQAATPGEGYSVAFATSTANGMLIFLMGVIVFYTGEAMHRDREDKIEPILWSMSAPNSVFLLSKFLTTISLTLVLILLAGLTAIANQVLRGQTPIDVSVYLITYSVILLPGIVFVTAFSMVLNVLLRDKHLTYAVSFGVSVGLFYVYSHGYNHWLYNPLLYQLWKYADLTSAGNNQAVVLWERAFWLASAGACLAIAHFFFQRKATTSRRLKGRLT